jgi:hypothetical protein
MVKIEAQKSTSANILGRREQSIIKFCSTGLASLVVRKSKSKEGIKAK